MKFIQFKEQLSRGVGRTKNHYSALGAIALGFLVLGEELGVNTRNLTWYLIMILMLLSMITLAIATLLELGSESPSKRAKLNELHQRMLCHEVENDQALVKLTAYELQRLLEWADK